MIQHGRAPFLECSSKGDRRLSAFCARIRGRGGRTIEEIYQGAKVFADGSTGLSWRAAKGRRAVNQAAVTALYSVLWDEYVAENPELVPVLLAAAGLQDLFGQPGRCCQATELWRIRNAAAAQADTTNPGATDPGATDPGRTASGAATPGSAPRRRIGDR